MIEGYEVFTIKRKRAREHKTIFSIFFHFSAENLLSCIFYKIIQNSEEKYS